MTLIKSISGIRGTIGGKPEQNLSPLDIVNFTAAYATLLRRKNGKAKLRIVLGRDARLSGRMVKRIVAGTLSGMGCDIINLGMATTPTVEMAVTAERADGGIILTASHNPRQWNALKLLNEKGEFLSAKAGEELLQIIDNQDFTFAEVDDLGDMEKAENYHNYHINKILELPLVDIETIRKANFTVALDCVNSVGGLVLPQLLKRLGVAQVVELYCEATGEFPHNPEPLPEHLGDLSEAVRQSNAHVGFVVDPDVDRLAIVDENGNMFGEEYTLVAVADYILQHKQGNTVSNLSSTRALRDITENADNQYFSAAVGEVNVVAAMKKHHAVIGGEGNGGVIYPELHYGRDSLVGIALFLSHLAKSGKSCSQLRQQYPQYVISKNKIQLTAETDVNQILTSLQKKYSQQPHSTIDGLKIEFDSAWVHLRKSNTEPIIRIYVEHSTAEKADKLAQQFIDEINAI